MEDILIIKLDELTLMYVEAESFPDGIKASWDQLEKLVNSPNHRVYYGLSKCIETKLIYRACVVPLDDDEPKRLGLKTITIPPSSYAAKKLINWPSKIPMFGTIFDELFKKYSTNKDLFAVEYYKDMEEVILMVPLI